MRGAAAVGLVLFVGCSGSAPEEGRPTIEYGMDTCTRCGMLITEERHAAVARHRSGEEARFDDVGELVFFLRVRDAESWTAWVATPSRWIPATEASYAVADAIATPMGTGVLAFADRQAASSATQSAADNLNWEELLETIEAPTLPGEASSER